MILSQGCGWMEFDSITLIHTLWPLQNWRTLARHLIFTQIIHLLFFYISNTAPMFRTIRTWFYASVYGKMREGDSQTNALNPLFGSKQSVAHLGLIPSAAWLQSQIWASPTSWWRTGILNRMISPQWLQAKKHSRTALSHGVPLPGSRTTKLCPSATQAVRSRVAVLLWLDLFRLFLPAKLN